VRPERLNANQRYRASTGYLFRIACLLDQMRGDGAIDYPEHLTRDHRTAGEEKTQLNKNSLGFSVFGKQSQIESGIGIAYYVDIVAA
jgi:hypothetical protein